MSRKAHKGIIIYNRSDAKKNEWFIEKMIDDGFINGLNLELVYSDELDDDIRCDFAIMRDRDYRISEKLEKKGIYVFNSSKVSRICNDKWETYSFFKDKSIPMMYTQQSKMPYPFVLKPRDGHGGASVYLIENSDQYTRAVDEINKHYYSSPVQNNEILTRINSDFIYQIVASDTGRDLRVYVLGDVVLTSMLRKSENDFRANFSLGGTASETSLSEAEMKLVAKVKKELDMDFAGIDIIYNNGNPVLNEIEDVVGTRMLYAYTDIDACNEYMKWIAKKLENIL